MSNGSAGNGYGRPTAGEMNPAPWQLEDWITRLVNELKTINLGGGL